ncbi:MAG: SemiSWEET transporter [Candidatus Saganbacteria bacterium]|nr:SemiSWEET transporter [Candidatus Saganbacteria bacterium]
MSFDYILWIGIAAAFLTTISFVPQVVKVAKIKETKDLSLLMYVLFSIGIVLWLVYGILIGSVPVIFANTATLALSVYLLLLKIKYG